MNYPIIQVDWNDSEGTNFCPRCGEQHLITFQGVANLCTACLFKWVWEIVNDPADAIFRAGEEGDHETTLE